MKKYLFLVVLLNYFNVNVLSAQDTLKVSPPNHFDSIAQFFNEPIEFEITIPSDYSSKKYMKGFGKKVLQLETTDFFDNFSWRDKNFNPTNKIEPGKTYCVRFFKIKPLEVKSEDCLYFLENQPNVFLTGMQGLALAYDLEKVQFPEGMIISFDHKKSLMKTFDDCHAVPIIQHWKSDEGFSSWSFQAVYLEMKCQADYLICFFEK
jgi:hypothetical protein